MFISLFYDIVLYRLFFVFMVFAIQNFSLA